MMSLGTVRILRNRTEALGLPSSSTSLEGEDEAACGVVSDEIEVLRID